MRKISGSRPAGAQDKKRKKHVRSLGNMEEEREKNGAVGIRKSAKRQRTMRSLFPSIQ